MSQDEVMDFEQALGRLEQIVAELDAGELSLDKALALFEEGMALRKLCTERLKKAEAVVEQYLEQETEATAQGVEE